VRTHGRQVPALTYSPQTWSNTPGATPINAQRLGHMEDGIEDASLRLDVVEPALSDLQDDVSALQGALGGGNSFTLPGGPAASRPAPLAHAVWVDDDLDYPIWGDGTAWRGVLVRRSATGLEVRSSKRDGRGGTYRVTVTLTDDQGRVAVAKSIARVAAKHG